MAERHLSIWQCLIDFLLAIILWYPVNFIAHEAGHLIPLMLTDVHDAEVTFEIGSWHYAGTISGYGFVPTLYLAPLIIFMGGWFAAITAVLIYRKLSFFKNPILKTVMLHSVIWQFLYSNVEGMVNAKWLPKTYHNTELSMILAIPLTVMYMILLYREKKQKMKALVSEALSEEA